MESTIKIDMSGLDRLKKSLKELEKKVRVGVPDEYAELADKLELGFVPPIGRFSPPRSHLRLPLEMREKEIANRAVLRLTDITPSNCKQAVEELGRASLDAINESFDTGGFGQWQDNTSYTIRLKGRNEPNIDTGSLRDSYNYEVVE